MSAPLNCPTVLTRDLERSYPIEDAWHHPQHSCIEPIMEPGIQEFVRRMAIWALLTPFLMLSLLSPSVMPMPGGDGGVLLTLCSGDGPVEMRIDPATGEPVRKSPAAAHERCAWAAARAIVADLAPPLLPVRSTRVAQVDPAPSATLLRRAEETGQPPATGPPATV